MRIISMWFCVILFTLAIHHSAEGQAIPIKLPDLKKKQHDSLQLSDIPVRSVELINQTRQEFQNLAPPSTVRKLKVRAGIVLASIDTTLLSPIDLNDPVVNMRYLENRRSLLQQEERKIKKEEVQLNEIVSSMEEMTTRLKKEADIWKKTRDRLLKDSLIRPIPEKLTVTIAFIDSSLNLLNKKTTAVFELLEKVMTAEVSIGLALENTMTLISMREMNALSVDQPPFFSQDFTRNYLAEIGKSFNNLATVRLAELIDYLGSQIGAVIFLFLLFGFLIWFFKYLAARIHVNMQGFGKFYKEMLLLVLGRPILAATILSLASTVLFFPDQPIIFREFSAYILVYPLIGVLNRILNRKYHLYLHAFSVVIILYIMLLLISSDTMIYRFLLLLIALAEIGLFCLLLINFTKNRLVEGFRKNFVYLFILLHLALAVTGLISNLAGRVILTEITINAAFINILNGVILFISVIILNGLITAGIDSSQGQRLNSLRIHGDKIKQRLVGTLNFITILYWFMGVMKAFRLDDYLYDIIGTILTHKITIGTASFSLDLLVIFFAVIICSYFLASFLQVILEQDVLNRLPLSKGLPHTIATGLKYGLVVSGFFLAFNATGIPMDKLTIILGAFSVGIGFGLQNIFSNMVSGLILLFERPIQLGDTVQVGQLIGNVKSIDLRSSNIHTFDGAEVIVPNGQLVSNEVINWTLSDKRRRIEVPVGVGYESDPKVVQSLLMQVLQNHPKVLQDPAPLVFFSGLGDSSLDFALIFWVDDYIEGRSTKSDVLFGVFETLKEHGINIPFPQRDIHIRTVEGKESADIPAQQR